MGVVLVRLSGWHNPAVDQVSPTGPSKSSGLCDQSQQNPNPSRILYSSNIRLCSTESLSSSYKSIDLSTGVAVKVKGQYHEATLRDPLGTLGHSGVALTQYTK
ncbi:hypothetical protein P7K49_007945, partial [Saguinus oedipus]